MTASQAVMTRAPSTPPPRAKDDGAVRQSEQNNGFEDALGRADTSTSEAGRSDQTAVEGDQPRDAGRQTLSGRGRAGAEEANAADDTAIEPSTDGTAATSQIPLLRHRLLSWLWPRFPRREWQPRRRVRRLRTSNVLRQPISGEAALTLVLDNAGAECKCEGARPRHAGRSRPCGRDAVAAWVERRRCCRRAGCGEPNDSESRQPGNPSRRGAKSAVSGRSDGRGARSVNRAASRYRIEGTC